MAIGGQLEVRHQKRTNQSRNAVFGGEEKQA